MDFTKDSDVFLENGVLIADVIGIRESLENIQQWLSASGTYDVEADRLVEDALHDISSLYRRLIDLQIQLLTFA